MNVLLIAIDTLRVDHLGCFGYRRPTSPSIDRLAAEGVRCSNFTAPGIPTHPSFTTLFSGQHPIRHGVVSHGGPFNLHHDTATIPQLFLDRGYFTASFDNLAHHKPHFGRGFEMIVDSSRKRGCGLMVTCEDINNRLLPFLKQQGQAKDPFFAFVHYWDPHTPYWAPSRYRNLFYSGDPCDPAKKSLQPLYDHPLGPHWREIWFKKVLEDTGRDPSKEITDAAYVEALYDQEIRHVDDGIADVLDTLDETGLAENTLVLLVADHGECMTEHGVMFDHHGLYPENLHVPLIARLPGRIPAGSEAAQLIQHLDILPTLCEAADLKTPQSSGKPEESARTIDGKSAWGIMTGSRPDEKLCDVMVSEECTWQKKWSYRDARYHFILARQPDWYGSPMRELYDLQADPELKTNIAALKPDIAAGLEAQLEGWIATRAQACGKKGDPLLETEVTLIDPKARRSR